ncbi:MAG: hypothetical protein Q9221_007204 [Calogaya cf. arnoldii]
MAWAEEKCMFCDEIVNHDGTSACTCPSRVTYHKIPEAPISATRLYYEAQHDQNDWRAAISAFEQLPLEERRSWEAKAMADRARFEREKTEYNNNLALDDEVLTDQEAEDKEECGNAVFDIRMALQRRRCEQQWARYRRDHRAFRHRPSNKTAIVGPGTFHRFRDLPTEIRVLIYTHLFDGSGCTKELRQWQLEYESPDIDADLRFTHLQPLDTRILATNRQIYAEALEVLYSSRCFAVDIARATIPPLFIRHPTGVVAPRPTSKMRRWHIRLTFTDVLHKESILPQLKLLHAVMKDCVSIDEVRFSWISVPDYWTEVPSLRREYEGMLELFRDIKNVGEVVFTMAFDEDERKRVDTALDGWNNLHLASEDIRRDVKACMESG